tara:strand:+ start:203 stop:523 length:321 start_codon:yes stop_codon:yes gene_type:complete
MPAKFKPSDRAMTRNSFGRMSIASGKTKPMVHHYLKCQSIKTLIDAINSDRTKPKHKQKCRNEVVRRGIKLVYQMEDGTQVERTRDALHKYYKDNPQEYARKLYGR